MPDSDARRGACATVVPPSCAGGTGTGTPSIAARPALEVSSSIPVIPGGTQPEGGTCVIGGQVEAIRGTREDSGQGEAAAPKRTGQRREVVLVGIYNGVYKAGQRLSPMVSMPMVGWFRFTADLE